MGIYTGIYAGVSDYTSVEPYDLSKNYNYHELGIIAAAESAMNTNAFMKQIGLGELAAVEQSGSDEVFYEAVNIKGIFDAIKKFFQKIIEKIHKIFHTFIAKLSSWFSSSKDFAKRYDKEIVKNWAKVKNDFEFKGYKYTTANKSVENSAAKSYGANMVKGSVGSFLDSPSESTIKPLLDESGTSQVSEFRAHFDELKDKIRGELAESTKPSPSASASYDQKEYTEELFKAFRNGEDSKVDLTKADIEATYGGSISGMISFLKEYDKIKSNVETAEKAFVKTVDELVKKVEKLEDQLLKERTEANAKDKEATVQACSLYQTFWGFIKETQLEMFSAYLTAIKDKCAQAKEIAVKTIGLSKKMTTNESTDMTGESTNYTGSFFESVQLR